MSTGPAWDVTIRARAAPERSSRNVTARRCEPDRVRRLPHGRPFGVILSAAKHLQV
jgi:hypothetical protein